MKRFLCLTVAVAVLLLVAVACSPVREKLQNWARTNSVDIFEGTELSDGNLHASAGAWARQLVTAIDDMDDSVIDGQFEVLFGSRTFNAESAQYEIRWGGVPSNVVKVVARGGGPIADDIEAAVPVVFTGVFANDGSLLRAEAIAYINAPDLADNDVGSEQKITAARFEQP